MMERVALIFNSASEGIGRKRRGLLAIFEAEKMKSDVISPYDAIGIAIFNPHEGT